MPAPGTLEVVLLEVSRLLMPLKKAIDSPESFYSFMLNLGWDADDIPQPLQQLGTGLDTLFTKLQAIFGGISLSGSVSPGSQTSSLNISPADVQALIQAIEQVIDGIVDIVNAPDAAIPAKLRDDGFREKFPVQLVNYLIITYLNTYQPPLAFGLRSFGVIKTEYFPASGNRKPYVEYQLGFSDIPKIFSDPVIIFRNAFGWGTPDFDFNQFIFPIQNLFHALKIDTFVEEIDTGTAKQIEGGVPVEGDPVRKALRAVFFERARDSGRLAAEMRFLMLPGDGASMLPGIAMLPAFNGILDFKMNLGPDIAVTIKSEMNLEGGVGLIIRPDEPIEFILGFDDSAGISNAGGNLEVKAERTNADGTPTIMLGNPDATRLEYKKIGGKGGINLSTEHGADVYVEVELNGLKFVFKPGEADGFIKNLVPPDGFSLDFELAAGYSINSGFYFRGSSAFEINLPAHIQLGPIELEGMTLTIKPSAQGLPVELGANINAALGPINASIMNMGLSVIFAFPGSGGNLGPVDVQVKFKPPNGVGLSIDTGVITGGGFLYLDFDKGEYMGALELEFKNMFSLKAIGIINTKMPDGSSGFSLLIIITAEFTPIQLGFGFTLNGVGGLLGLNRTTKVDVLREGVKTNALKSILFPEDVVANINRIVSDLKQVFPIMQGHFIVGPMAKIGWASIVTLELGLLIELPEPRIIILGVLKAMLPAEDAPLLKLQVNFLGVIDFENKYISFDASLYDSRLLVFTLTGDMALRISWGSNALFILSVGGFHPAFKDVPADLKGMKRLSISLLSGDNPRIGIEAYFAVTSNTVQFGAKAELYAEACGFNVWGYIGFDVLFQFDPFYFIASIYAGLALRSGTTVLLGIKLRGELSGPTPWNVNGEASFTILFFEISVSFDVTWGDDPDELPKETINVLEELKKQLMDSRNWKAEIPSNNSLFVSIKKYEPPEGEIVIHPFGVLSFNETLVPLDIAIDKFGSKKPEGDKKFALSDIKSGSIPLSSQKIKDRFAPAQFLEMKDSEKISRPSFEMLNSGFSVTASAQLNIASPVEKKVDYEVAYLRKKRFSLFFAGILTYGRAVFDFMIRAGAVSQSPMSIANKIAVNAPEEVKINTEEFVIANVSNMSPYAENMRAGSQAEAYSMYNSLISSDPSLKGKVQVLSTFELNN
jgi:hypothetical protein